MFWPQGVAILTSAEFLVPYGKKRTRSHMDASKYKHVVLDIIFPEDPMVTYFFRLGWLIVLVLGTFGAYGFKQDIANYAAVDSWPSTTGTVVESSVVEEMLPQQGFSGGVEYIYQPRIVYEYKINGGL